MAGNEYSFRKQLDLAFDDVSFCRFESYAANYIDAVSVSTLHALAGEAAGICEGSNIDNVFTSSRYLGIKRLHIIVDEAQDLSEEQLNWIDDHAKTIFAVGDHTLPLLEDQFVDMAFIARLTGLSDKWFYKLIQDGQFPKPIKFGRSSRWLKSEVEAWIQARIQASRVD